MNAAPPLQKDHRAKLRAAQEKINKANIRKVDRLKKLLEPVGKHVFVYRGFNLSMSTLQSSPEYVQIDIRVSREFPTRETFFEAKPRRVADEPVDSWKIRLQDWNQKRAAWMDTELNKVEEILDKNKVRYKRFSDHGYDTLRIV